MPAASVTPPDLNITPRDRRFAREVKPGRWWHGGDPFATAFYNALSATFPKGEAFFVESVRAYREDAPAKLAEEIKAFTTQEAIHSREHAAFNKAALDAGYDLKPLEAQLEFRLSLLQARPPIASLAATMALEHFTAILAHELLGDPRHLGPAEAEAGALWRWHAIEEIEHKGVAYDTWLHATRQWPRSKRWKVKSKVMLLVTRNFILDRTRGALELLRQDGITGLKAWSGLIGYMWVRPGMMRKIFGAWAAYFMPGFHPWNEDDRYLIDRYEAEAALGTESARKVRRAAA
ncbi:MAG TPA: metal-dependent hydrolase [Sphingomicrobium sp.]|jgi:predicted metal-dependent hydrolase|nr:metal-dependent hydrolase [Sphingomicrobium sp.]